MAARSPFRPCSPPRCHLVPRCLVGWLRTSTSPAVRQTGSSAGYNRINVGHPIVNTHLENLVEPPEITDFKSTNIRRSQLGWEDLHSLVDTVRFLKYPCRRRQTECCRSVEFAKVRNASKQLDFKTRFTLCACGPTRAVSSEVTEPKRHVGGAVHRLTRQRWRWQCRH